MFSRISTTIRSQNTRLPKPRLATLPSYNFSNFSSAVKTNDEEEKQNNRSPPPPKKTKPTIAKTTIANLPGIALSASTAAGGFILADHLGTALLSYQGVDPTLVHSSPISGIPIGKVTAW